MPLLLGLTGGIASGKSTVSQYFEQRNFPLIDADVVARKVVEPGSKGLALIVEAFGSEILASDQSLNREALGKIIFHDDTKRELLNTVLADEIKQEIVKELLYLTEANYELIVLDIPLLFEAGYDAFVDQTMVVYVDEETQLNRLMLRDGIPEHEAQARIKSQMSLEEKVKKSDCVIDNSDSLELTYQQLDIWLNNYKNNLEKKS